MERKNEPFIDSTKRGELPESVEEDAGEGETKANEMPMSPGGTGFNQPGLADLSLDKGEGGRWAGD